METLENEKIQIFHSLEVEEIRIDITTSEVLIVTLGNPLNPIRYNVSKNYEFFTPPLPQRQNRFTSA